jgi:hypothetical protein
MEKLLLQRYVRNLLIARSGTIKEAAEQAADSNTPAG